MPYGMAVCAAAAAIPCTHLTVCLRTIRCVLVVLLLSFRLMSGRYPLDVSIYHGSGFRYSVFKVQILLEQILFCSLEMEGFEPLTPCLQGRCSPS